MRRIRFQPIHGMSEAFVPDVETIFRDGEVKEVSDEDASTLLTNPNFIDDDTGWNPTFRCLACGATSLSDAFPSPNNALIPYRDEHGHRLCVEDFLARHPGWAKWHRILQRRGRGERISARTLRAAVNATPTEPTDAQKLLPPGTLSLELTAADTIDQRVEQRQRSLRALRNHKHSGLPKLDAFDLYMNSVANAGKRYFEAWPAERDAVLAEHDRCGSALVAAFGFADVENARCWFEQSEDRTIGQLDADLLSRWRGPGKPPTLPWLSFRAWLDADDGTDGGALGSVMAAWTIPIVAGNEISQILSASDEQLRSWPPVMIRPTGSTGELHTPPNAAAVASVIDKLGAVIAGSSQAFTENDLPAGNLRKRFAVFKEALSDRFLLPVRYLYTPEVRELYREFARAFYAWRTSSRRGGRTGHRIVPFFAGRPSFPVVNTNLTFAAHLALSSGQQWKPAEDYRLSYSEQHFSKLRFSIGSLEGASGSHTLGLEQEPDNEWLEVETSIIYDALMAKWLDARRSNALGPEKSVVVFLDDILDLRGFKKHKSGGYRVEQRRALAERILQLERIVVTGLYTAPDKRDHRISGRLLNVALDEELTAGGHAVPFAFRISPGDAIFRFYDDVRYLADYFTNLAKLDVTRASGKTTYRIGRYLVYQYRIRESKGNFDQPFSVRTMLERSGIPIEANANHYTRFQEHFEGALDELRKIGVVDGWEYVKGDTPVHGWFGVWLDDKVIIRPPSAIANRSGKRVAAATRRISEAKRTRR